MIRFFSFIRKMALPHVQIDSEKSSNFSCGIKKCLILLILFIIYFIFCAVSYVNAVSSDISESVFRLHVIANSDSQEDQNLKYIVRDAVLDYIHGISTNATSKEEIIFIANQNKEKIQEIAKETVIKNGYSYNVNVIIGNFDFPTKTYGDISLPAGKYDAVRIEIGRASGQNWWCVMFPPLCFVDVSSGIVPEESKEMIRSNLSEEEYELISENNADVKFKFKLLELFQNFSVEIAKN